MPEVGTQPRALGKQRSRSLLAALHYVRRGARVRVHCRSAGDAELCMTFVKSRAPEQLERMDFVWPKAP